MTSGRMARGLGAIACLLIAFASAGCKKELEAGAAPASAAASPPILAQWTTSATAQRARVGQPILVLCPPNGVVAPVWGSDVYSDDSSICTAALHSGRITLAGGGMVSIAMLGGQPAYAATTRNGVETRPYGAFAGSFTIVGGATPGLVAVPVAPAAPTVNLASAIPIEWGTQGRARVRNGESQLVFCRPMGRSHAVWGTDTYTNDSSICTAAVHAGVITMMMGGPVMVTAVGGQGGYMGSNRNGVRTQSYGAWGGSFRVTAPTGAAPAKP